jgi:hypothetical protein
MVMPHDEPNLDDVMTPEETVVEHRREHGKASPRPDEDGLDRRTEAEWEEVERDEEERE